MESPLLHITSLRRLHLTCIAAAHGLKLALRSGLLQPRKCRNWSCDSQAVRFKDSPVFWIVSVHRMHTSQQRCGRVASIVNASCSQAVCCGQLQGAQSHFEFGIKHANGRWRFNKETHRFGCFFWLVVWLRFLPCQGAIDLAQDAGGCASMDLTAARGLDQRTRLSMSRVTLKQCTDEHASIKEN